MTVSFNRRAFLKGVFAIAALSFVALGPMPAHAVSVERVVSPGGIEAWLVRDSTNPILSLRLAFRGGASLDPAGKEGLARMTADLLVQGAGDMDSKTFLGTLEDLAIALSFDAAFDSIGGSLRTLTEHRDTAFRLFRLALTQPRFDDDAIARVRSQILAGLRRDTEDPETIAQITLFATLFPGHPYGRRSRGTLDSIPTITAEDLRAFVKQRFARDNLLIGVTGDIGAKELGELLDKTFADLPAKAAPWLVPETAPALADRTIVVQKSVPQSAITFAGPGLKRDDPDFYAAYVLNHILGGGGFTSRLYQEVRERRGLAYSAGSHLLTLAHAALLQGGAGTANARVAETIAVVRDEWRRLAETGVTPAELADAKTYLTGSFPLRFNSTGSIAAILVAMQIDRLGIDFLDRRNGYIEAVTPDDVNRVAKRLVRPDRLLTVVVGDPKGVASTN